MKITARLPSEGERQRIDCLNGVLIRSERRSGNTTRLIDNAIQYIMDGYVCKITDHHPSYEMQRNVFSRILRRIEIEHRHEFEQYLMVNKEKFYIWIDKTINQQRP
jgi:hypothetical protein